MSATAELALPTAPTANPITLKHDALTAPSSQESSTNRLALDLKFKMESMQEQLTTSNYNTLPPTNTDDDYTDSQGMQQSEQQPDQTPSTSHATSESAAQVLEASPDYENSKQSLSQDTNGKDEEEVGIMSEKGKFLNAEQKRKFQTWAIQNPENLYPTRDEKLALAKLLNATYLQVTRLLANNRRRLQVQRKRKTDNSTPSNTVDGKDDVNLTEEENQLNAPSTDVDKLVMEHVQSVVDEMSALGTKSIKSNDMEARISHISQLHCDESFEDLDEPNENPVSATVTVTNTQQPLIKSTLAERNQRIDSVIDEVVQYVNQMPQSVQQQKDGNYVTPPPSAPLGDLSTMVSLPNSLHPSTPSTTSTFLPQQDFSTQQTDPITTLIRRPESSMQMNGTLLSASVQNLDKCDTLLTQQAQMLDNSVQHGQIPQQQNMHAINSLNLGAFLSQPQTTTPSVPSTQTPTNLLPLIQKLLAGEFMSNRSVMDEKLAVMDSMAQRPTMKTTPQVSSTQQQPTGTSLALNQLIGNNQPPQPQQQSQSSVATPAQQLSPVVSSTQQTQPPPTIADPSSMLYPGLQATLNAFIAANGTHTSFLQPQPNQPTLTQPAVADLFQQALIRQQQNHLLSLLQSRDPLVEKLAGNPAALNSVSMTSDFLGVNNCVEKPYTATASNAPSHLMSPPLSSNASSSPRLFSNEPAFSDISTCSNSPAPLDTSIPRTSTPAPPSSLTLFATPPSTVKKEKSPRKTKKQMRLEEQQQNGENLTPVARKRHSSGKKEMAKKMSLNMGDGSTPSKKKRQATTAPQKIAIVPRKINELTENESIAVAVLAGLANGRFS